MVFRALWQTANRTNARLKATLGGFHGPLTFFIEVPSFFDNSFDIYPIGEKTEVADYEKRTPEVKFRLFYLIIIPEILSGNTASAGTVKITASSPWAKRG